MEREKLFVLLSLLSMDKHTSSLELPCRSILATILKSKDMGRERRVRGSWPWAHLRSGLLWEGDRRAAPCSSERERELEDGQEVAGGGVQLDELDVLGQVSELEMVEVLGLAFYRNDEVVGRRVELLAINGGHCCLSSACVRRPAGFVARRDVGGSARVACSGSLARGWRGGVEATAASTT